MKLAFAMPHLTRVKAMTQPWEINVSGADQTRMAKLADAWGYDMLSVPEHFIIPNAHLDLSGPHYFHAAAGQGYFAGATERIKINSSIAILPLQNPIVTAKALSTIDWMSSGRIITTFAVGWLKEEFEILGVPFHERGRIADEYLAAIIELWTKDAPEFEGKYISFKDVAFEPKPFQKPHVAIWMGGDSDAALKRAARFATGWWPAYTKPEELRSRLDFLRSQPGYKGEPFEVMYGLGSARISDGHVPTNDPNARAGMSAQQIIDRMNWFREQGVTMSSVPIPPVSGLDEYLDFAQWVVEEVKPKVG